MNPCRICRQPVELLLDFGPQPLCNRFLAEPSAAEERHPLRLGQCPACGLLQLVQPAAAAAVKPPRPMSYNEPEWHLDQVVDQITALPGVMPDARICGVTYKDATVVARLQRRGYANAVGVEGRDWGVKDPAAGVETLQERISAATQSGCAGDRGRYQVVIARHILEHAHDLPRFLAGLQGLLATDGYLIFEVPDFAASLRDGNYCTIWEEHVVYFTKTTFPGSLRRLGLGVREVVTYPSTLEGLLVGVTQLTEQASAAAAQDVDVAGELAQGRQYASRLPAVREAWRQTLAGERAAGRQVALLGAGHLAIMFLNLLELQDAIDFVVDDDPAKCGWYLPGSRLPVYPSDVLYARPVRLCLTSVAPENEGKVRQRYRRFLESGGRLVSVFSSNDPAKAESR